MPYTLVKGLVWLVLAVVLGIVIGWLLRSVAAKRQVARARAHNIDAAEMERLRDRVAVLEPVVVERDLLRAQLDEWRHHGGVDRRADDGGDRHVATGGTEVVVPVVHTPPGREVADDLTVVEGIGPRIAELCNGIGIMTWSDLAATEVSLLRTMLSDAGSRFRGHDPTTWPQQARLLAEGRWDDFAALTDELQGGRPVD
jgi:hypothetical protein